LSTILSRLGSLEVKQATFDAHREWAEERIQKHDKDLYEGNGLPSITNRLSAVEMIAGMAKWLTVTAVINTIALFVFLVKFWISKGGH
jgi:hypothetical protein